MEAGRMPPPGPPPTSSPPPSPSIPFAGGSLSAVPQGHSGPPKPCNHHPVKVLALLKPTEHPSTTEHCNDQLNSRVVFTGQRAPTSVAPRYTYGLGLFSGRIAHGYPPMTTSRRPATYWTGPPRSIRADGSLVAMPTRRSFLLGA